MVSQFTIGKDRLSIGTDGEINPPSVNMQSPLVNDLIIRQARIQIVMKHASSLLRAVGTVGTDG
jgi:hypothetical protein